MTSMRSKNVKDKKGSVIVKYWKSNRSNKKWATKRPDGRIIHFGQKGMKDYTQHHSKERRKRFRSRMSGIRLKSGSRAIDKRYSPAWLSFYVTW